jgi:hypothetical protein
VVAVDAGAMQIELRGRVVLSRAETVLQSTRHDTVRAEIGYGEKVSQRLCLKKLDGGRLGEQAQRYAAPGRMQSVRVGESGFMPQR